jgi:hypothetical protein
MPARTAFRFRGESGRPNVEAIVRVSNGFAEMESLTILNAAAGGIRTLDLRNVVVDTVVAQVADLTAFQVTKLPGGWFEISDAPNAGSVVTTQRVRGRGHPRTPEDRIRRAGEIYEGAAGHEPRKRVADELGVSRRTASRYIEAWRATTRKGEA